MAHIPQAELAQMISEATKKVKTGELYAHYKNADNNYRVLGFVIIEATDEVGVMYQAQFGEKVTFVRPLSSWLDKVEVNGQFVPRFSRKI